MTMNRMMGWLLCALAAGSATAAELVVDQKSGVYRTIGAAVKSAKAGDTIVVNDGVYRERLVIQEYYEGAPLTIRPAEGARAVISGFEPVTGWQEWKSGIYVAKVSGEVKDLYVGYIPQQCSRWPANGTRLPIKETDLKGQRFVVEPVADPCLDEMAKDVKNACCFYYFAYGRKNGLDLAERGVKMPLKKLGLSALLALIVVTVGYAIVFVEDYFFLADFRLWTLAIKAFEAPILRYLAYVLLFFTYYIAISVATNSFNYNTIGGKCNGILCGLFAAAPALVLPWIQYATYYSTGHMMWFQRTMADANYPMFVLWLFPIVLILFGSTLISRVIYKATKNPYIAGIINAIIVGIMTITNTCTVFT